MRRFYPERVAPSETFANEPHAAYFMYLARYLFAARSVTGKRVLDAGCGLGYGAALLAEKGAREVVGIDVSPEAIEYATHHYRRANVSFRLMNCEKLEFRNGTFGLVSAVELVEHLKHPEMFVAEAARVLKRDGLLIASTPNRARSGGHSSKWFNPYHEHELFYEELSDLLGRHFSRVEIFGERIRNPDFQQYYESVDRFRRRIPFSVRRLVPNRIRILVRQRLFGKVPQLDPGQFYYSKDNVRESESFVARCVK